MSNLEDDDIYVESVVVCRKATLRADGSYDLLGVQDTFLVNTEALVQRLYIRLDLYINARRSASPGESPIEIYVRIPNGDRKRVTAHPELFTEMDQSAAVVVPLEFNPIPGIYRAEIIVCETLKGSAVFEIVAGEASSAAY